MPPAPDRLAPPAPPSTPQELVRWVPETCELPVLSEVRIHAFSGDAWSNVRVCRKETRGAFAMPRGHVESDLVAIVLRAPDREHGRFGHEHVTNRGTRGAVNVIPAGMTYTYSWEGIREILHLSVDREVRGPDDVVEVTPLRPAFAVADPLLLNLGTALLTEAAASEPAARLYGETLGMALSAHLEHRYGSRAATSARRARCLSRRQLQQVQDYIEAHLAGPLGLEDLARVAGMGRTQFLREFRRSFGTSPHRHVMERRAELAKALLADPDLELHEIAARTGYSQQATFTRAFRQIVRVSPGAYRRSTSG